MTHRVKERRRVGPPQRADEPALVCRVAERRDLPGDRERPLTARTLDWRLLLPEPAGRPLEHALLLGGSHALVATLLDSRFAKRVSLTPSHDRVDAIVSLAGSGMPAEAAVRMLRPGGVLYCEIDRRSPKHLGLTPGRVNRRLTRLGLTPAGAYWVKPGFPRREMYLPLRSSAATRWYLDTLYRPTTASRRALKAGLRAVSALPHGLQAVAPCFAVTATAGPVTPPAVLTHASAFLDRKTDDVDAVLIAHGANEWNRMVLLLFDRGSADPAVAVKVARSSAYNDYVVREHRCLQDLARALDGSLRDSLPSSRLLWWNDLAVAVESCVPGATLNSRTGLQGAALIDDLRVSSAWLTRFHAATIAEAPPAREWLTRRLLGDLCAAYERAFGLTTTERSLFAVLAARVAALGPMGVPLAWQHADFGPWNIYRSGARVSVIDWEGARRGPVLADLFYFVTQWHCEIAGVDDDIPARVRLFDRLFGGGSYAAPLEDAIRAEIVAYSRRLSLPPSLIGLLLVYTVLEQAVDGAHRAALTHGPASIGRTGNTYVAYLELLARHAGHVLGAEAARAA